MILGENQPSTLAMSETRTRLVTQSEGSVSLSVR